MVLGTAGATGFGFAGAAGLGWDEFAVDPGVAGFTVAGFSVAGFSVAGFAVAGFGVAGFAAAAPVFSRLGAELVSAILGEPDSASGFAEFGFTDGFAASPAADRAEAAAGGLVASGDAALVAASSAGFSGTEGSR